LGCGIEAPNLNSTFPPFLVLTRKRSEGAWQQAAVHLQNHIGAETVTDIPCHTTRGLCAQQFISLQGHPSASAVDSMRHTPTLPERL
jgi:hypothetical protein